MSNKPLHEWQAVEVGPDANSVSEVLTWLFEEESFAPVAKLTAQDSYSVVSDHLGTPLALYNEKGMLAWTMALDTYGAVRQGKGRAQDCPFRYQGQYEDTETGLYYNRLRYYDPEVGCYISQDPIQLEGGLGLYSYVSNSTAYIDPFGLSSCTPKRPGGHQAGDVSNHGTLSPGKNRATGHTNTRADNFVQSHHPIQNEWAKRNVTGYDEYDAPATLLKSSSGSPHAKISVMQRARRRLPDGWKGSLKDEFNISYKEMIDAGVPKAQAQKALQKSYKYFDSIGAF
jgi:RHS repeat-associated protein